MVWYGTIPIVCGMVVPPYHTTTIPLLSSSALALKRQTAHETTGIWWVPHVTCYVYTDMCFYCSTSCRDRRVRYAPGKCTGHLYSRLGMELAVGWVLNLCQTEGLSGLGTHLLATPIHAMSAPVRVTQKGWKLCASTEPQLCLGLLTAAMNLHDNTSCL
jgi:hypothetical protein